MAVNRNVCRSPSGGPAYVPNDVPLFRGGDGSSYGPWTPAALFASGEYGDYWDASDSTKLYENTGDASPNVVATDPVGKWKGQRGVLEFLQGVSGDKPVWQTTYVRGVGVKSMYAVLTAQTATTAYTLYTACSVEAWTANGGRGIPLSYTDSAGTALHSCLRHVGVGGANNIAGSVKSTVYPTGGGVTLGTARRNTSLRWSGSGSGTIRVGATDTTVVASTATTVPARLNISSEDTQRWYKILYINRQLTVPELVLLEAWGAL